LTASIAYSPRLPHPERVRKDAAWDASLRSASTLTPELTSALARWFSALTGVSTAQITAALTAGEAGAVIASIWDSAAENEGIDDLDARLQTELTAVVSGMVERAGLSQWKSLGLGAGFTLRNPYSEAWIPSHVGELVTGVSDRTKSVIAEIVGRGFVQGNPPREMAAEIEQVIGLDAVRARQIAALAEDGASDALLARLHKQGIRDRALTIARTETIDAHAAGAVDSWRAARDRGLLPKYAKKVWIAAVGSERTCARCLALDGLVVELDGQFSAAYVETDGGKGYTVTTHQPTAHPRCRCSLALRYT
jgi:hypothetical protein